MAGGGDRNSKVTYVRLSHLLRGGGMALGYTVNKVVKGYTQNSITCLGFIAECVPIELLSKILVPR